jgi:hypothetical protein
MRDLGGGRFTTGELKSTSPVKDATFRNIAHAVWKMAIEWLYVLIGPAAGFDPIFDPVRHAILGTGDRTGWLLSRVTAWPNDHIHHGAPGDHPRTQVSTDVLQCFRLRSVD